MTLGRKLTAGVHISLVLVVALFPDSVNARPWSDSGGRYHGSRISAGAIHTCQVKGDGTVRCWGSNEFGQLGNGAGGTGQIESTPVRVVKLTNAIAVASGGRHTCALLSTGIVRCWGDNSFGQLGDGNGGFSGATSSSPVNVTNLTNAVALAAGSLHTCAVRATGRVSCWGSNGSGQIGNGRLTSLALNAGTVVIDTNNDEITNAVAIAAGSRHTCAVRSAGGVSCWGDNTFSQLGNGSDDSLSLTAVDISSLTDAVTIAAGSAHNCVARANGRVSCWGSDSSGQIGQGGVVRNPVGTPQQLANISNVVSVAAGREHTCARMFDSTLRCWGANESAQVVGLATTFEDQTLPVTVIERLSLGGPVPLANVEVVTAGGGHTCSLDVNEVVRCWGANSVGQRGDGSTTSSFSISSVLGGSGSITARDVSVGGVRTCARRSDGTVACWSGSGDPTAVPGLNRILAVSAGGGSRHCALRVDGTVWCFGVDSSGQLQTPVQVAGVTDAIAVATGTNHACVLRAGGTVQCFGSNSSGQVGNGRTAANEPTPADVIVAGGALLTNVIGLTLGDRHSCALRVGGTVHCWGSNGFGQIGQTSNPRTTATLVTDPDNSMANLVGIAAGPDHTCAARVDGRTFCWGSNSAGQLGDGTEDPLFPGDTNPDRVLGLTDAVALAGGGGVVIGSVQGGFSCARRAGGTLQCWGDNNVGQLGDQSTTDHLQPETSVIFRTTVRLANGATFTLSSALIASAVSAHSLRACALRADGQPFCWGGGQTFATAVPSFSFNVDPNVTLIGGGRVARVTALINCTEDENVQVRISLRQGDTSGEGTAAGPCTGGLGRYLVTVAARGASAFTPGPAQASADAIVRDGGLIVATPEWTRTVQLVLQ